MASEELCSRNPPVPELLFDPKPPKPEPCWLLPPKKDILSDTGNVLWILNVKLGSGEIEKGYQE